MRTYSVVMRWAILVCAALTLGACAAGDDPDPTGTGDTVTTTPSEDTMTTRPDESSEDGQPEPVTEADDGGRIALEVGSEVPWRLSSDWDWEQPTVEGGSIELVPVDYLVDPGYREWLIVGTAAGAAELSVEGAGACGDPERCPDRVVTLTVDVGD